LRFIRCNGRWNERGLLTLLLPSRSDPYFASSLFTQKSATNNRNNDSYIGYNATEDGYDWILDHQEEFTLRRVRADEPQVTPVRAEPTEDGDIPF